ncbi:ATP-dependent Clp protease ATP-binding subunit [Candidatus Uhrbacteria bacterium]|nr:ATP-dependent Clp protease ATP-binding subunit [Candidatus Uhrbacteria bacterium]
MTEWIIRIAVLVFVLALFYMMWQKQQKAGGGPPGKTKGGNLGSFTTDLTEMAEKGQLDPFAGREDEIERVIHIILRRTKNNPLLLGEPGVGKTAVVEGLAIRMSKGEVPEKLKGKRLVSLNVNALVSDTKFRGELETRLRGLLEEIQGYGRKVILFIDEIHVLQQVGKSEGSLAITDVLKPALARGDLQLLGATTWSEYQEFIKPDQALDRRLQPVLVDEPNQEIAIKMLKGIRGTYEEFHNVKITDEAIEAAVKLSDEKISGRYLPDKAIDLMDEASAKVSIEGSNAHIAPMGVVHAASKEADGTVNVDDISDVVDQWVIHSKAEEKRDARR